MYDHIGLHVQDLDASIAFYAGALAPLGYVKCSQDATSASFGLPNAPALYLYRAKKSSGPGTHVALRTKDRKTVKRFHEGGLEAGGKDHGAPGVRADYSPTYYAAFLLDPDGNNVEAVCTEAQ